MSAQQQNATPLSQDEMGGAGKPSKELITRRDVYMVVIAVGLALAAAAYLHSEFNQLRSDINQVQSSVHENAKKLAVVKTEIKALRRDFERLDERVSQGEPISVEDPDKLVLRSQKE